MARKRDLQAARHRCSDRRVISTFEILTDGGAKHRRQLFDEKAYRRCTFSA